MRLSLLGAVYTSSVRGGRLADFGAVAGGSWWAGGRQLVGCWEGAVSGWYLVSDPLPKTTRETLTGTEREHPFLNIIQVYLSFSLNILVVR
jgi:hypothetical protein